MARRSRRRRSSEASRPSTFSPTRIGAFPATLNRKQRFARPSYVTGYRQILAASRPGRPASGRVRPIVIYSSRSLTSLSVPTGRAKLNRAGRLKAVVLEPRPRVPARVFRKPTRMRGALVRTRQTKSSKRAHACKCSEARSERQRAVTRRFIAGYGGRSNMTKKIGACSCH